MKNMQNFLMYSLHQMKIGTLLLLIMNMVQKMILQKIFTLCS